MRGAKHKTWLKFQELDKPVEEFADSPSVWVDKYIIRGTITPTGGSESVSAQKSTPTFSHTIECRNPASVVPIGFKQSMRVLVDDESIPIDDDKRKFFIESITASDDHKYIEMGVTERLE